MEIKEAIILAGGLGTRLRDTVPDLPKCLAPVAGNPFLYYVIDHLSKQGIEKFIFAVGYKKEMIEDFLQHIAIPIHWQVSIETEPLGTGGALKQACSKAVDPTVLVLNGDTLFRVEAQSLAAFHGRKQAACSLSLKPMTHFERYGVVELNPDDSVKSFQEKKYYPAGLINGGVYALQVDSFLKEDLPAVFSFEKDWLEKFYTQRPVFGLVQDQYFIDIGIPEDYERAQQEFLPFLK
jgi:D-glycero-alpha-D-manno-heptose 1-phosphate guanylyltransferase